MGNKTRFFAVIIGAIVVLGIAAFLFYPKVKTPTTLKAGSFTTETVERGEVVSSIKASGIVESENEALILCPERSIVKQVLKEPGSWVEKGELILLLEEENVKKEIERISDQLEMKRNTLDKTKLNAQSARLDLGYNEEVKKLRITSLKSTLADQQQLLEVGGISPARIEKTKQEIVLAEKDLQTLTEKNSIRLKQLEADEKGLLLQIKIQEKTLTEKKELLGKLKITAPSAGIILSVSGNKGERVEGGRTLVRMSDLSSFKVIGSVDEQFAKQIKTGNRVHVILDNENLLGRIGNITPMVENKKVQFNVHLKEKSHPKLIANQNVGVDIILSERDDVLRIRKTAALEAGDRQKFFVVKNNEAIKTEVILGTIGNDWCEIVSGVGEGQAVITDISGALRNMDKIAIEN